MKRTNVLGGIAGLLLIAAPIAVFGVRVARASTSNADHSTHAAAAVVLSHVDPSIVRAR